MPSVPDFIDQAAINMETVKAFDSIETFVDVENADRRLTCEKSNNCRVTYRWSHTPIVYYLSSPIMYSGMNVSLYMNPRKGPDYKRADDLPADIQIEGFRFLTEDYTTDSNFGKDSKQGIRGVVRATQRTNDADVEVWFRGIGNALWNEASSTTCNWDRTDCYKARIYPHIDEISETSGSIKGGQEIVITGSSFDRSKTVEVSVDDVDCQVTEVTGTTITCVTGEKTLGVAKPGYPGENGLYRTLVNENGGADASNYDSLPNERTLLTNAEIPTNQYTENGFSMIQGYYEAPVDGEY